MVLEFFPLIGWKGHLRSLINKWPDPGNTSAMNVSFFPLFPSLLPSFPSFLPCLCSNISPSAGLLFPSLSAKNIPFVLSISSLFSSEHFHHRPYYIFTLCDCVSAPYNAKPMKIGIFNLYPEHIRQWQVRNGWTINIRREQMNSIPT